MKQKYRYRISIDEKFSNEIIITTDLNSREAKKLAFEKLLKGLRIKHFNLHVLEKEMI